MTPAEKRVLLSWHDYCAATGPLSLVLLQVAGYLLAVERHGSAERAA